MFDLKIARHVSSQIFDFVSTSIQYDHDTDSAAFFFVICKRIRTEPMKPFGFFFYQSEEKLLQTQRKREKMHQKNWSPRRRRFATVVKTQQSVPSFSTWKTETLAGDETQQRGGWLFSQKMTIWVNEVNRMIWVWVRMWRMEEVPGQGLCTANRPVARPPHRQNIPDPAPVPVPGLVPCPFPI